ncbi:futalosine hydrolase [Flavitalea sp. BT771]|uniref:futalosine hydrolase n=1 Tax=Flavitalea sp. BT771 TaxID=3063329 RepID=UPI0026E4382A|nr:futalosine hydrolase [Flavitalea sp. BT771]MDO6429702.1 futalosine hydrolase [Flavitalea sp. BT771]MDV6218170.1 futalosine hydrolase [Flavitalea sp. BT771]
MNTDICSMHIVLAAATSFEIQPTIDLLTNGSAPGGHTTDVLITGIGSLSTVYALMRQIGRRKPDIVIQAGIAGCFTPGRIGAVLAVKEEVLGDLGVKEGQDFKTVFDLHLVDRDVPPFHNGLLINPHNNLLNLTGLDQVRGITINEISTDKDRIDWYQQNMSPVVESMEGGALHFTCLQEGIPFLQLRSVSNDIGQRDKSRWDIRSAIAHLNQQLMETIKKI